MTRIVIVTLAFAALTGCGTPPTGMESADAAPVELERRRLHPLLDACAYDTPRTWPCPPFLTAFRLIADSCDVIAVYGRGTYEIHDLGYQTGDLVGSWLHPMDDVVCLDTGAPVLYESANCPAIECDRSNW